MLEGPTTFYSQSRLQQRMVLLNLSRGWCLIGRETDSFLCHALWLVDLWGCFKMGPVVGLNSFWVRVTLLKSRMVPGSDMWHRLSFQPSGCGFNYCKHVALKVTGLGECDKVNLPGPPHIHISAIVLYTRRIYSIKFHIRTLNHNVCG